jgi:hypothetical protein
MQLSALVLLLFSLILLTIGLVAVARLRRANGSATTSLPAPGGTERRPPAAKAAPAPSAPGPLTPGHAFPREPSRSAEMYPGGVSADGSYGAVGSVSVDGAEVDEIRRLRAELALLRARNGDGSPGLKRTQALVAVAANVSGILGLLVSVAALVK